MILYTVAFTWCVLLISFGDNEVVYAVNLVQSKTEESSIRHVLSNFTN
jgi:hypothetical protein